MKLEDLAAGRIPILVGTHAVFQKDVAFHDLRLAVVDEQHRFGVAQRMELGAKGQAVDVLVMTATPIPRSSRWPRYGDMDVSVLDEKPPGRKPIKTALVARRRMDEVVAHLRNAPWPRGGRPIGSARWSRNPKWWITPVPRNAFAALRAELGRGGVGLVHGQMPPAEKDAAMARFRGGRDLGAGGDHGDRGRGERAQRHHHGDRAGGNLWPGAVAPVARPGRARRLPPRPVC